MGPFRHWFTWLEVGYTAYFETSLRECVTVMGLDTYTKIAYHTKSTVGA